MAIAALADPDPQCLHDAAALVSHPDVVRASDHRELLDAPLEAVCIASPDTHHVRQVLDSLAAGKHVLCEKPLTRSESELRDVIEARDSTDLVVAMTYQRRYDAAHRTMRQRILSGEFGRVTAVTVYNSEDWITPNRGTWRHDPERCPGGFFYDASGHQLDMVMWATGLSPATVAATVSCAGTRVPIRVWGVAELAGEVPMTFHFIGDGHAWREQINIHCERMDFIVENYRPKWIEDGKPVEIVPESSTLGADAEFVGMIRGELPNPAPPDELWPVLRFTNAALESARTGRTADC